MHILQKVMIITNKTKGFTSKYGVSCLVFPLIWVFDEFCFRLIVAFIYPELVRTINHHLYIDHMLLVALLVDRIFCLPAITKGPKYACRSIVTLLMKLNSMY